MCGEPTRRRLLLGCGACLAPTLAGCGESPAPTETLTPAEVPPSATVAVGPRGELVFEPGTDEPLGIAVGTTVQFVWRSDNHNISVTEQPRGASWTGTPGDRTETYDEGYVHEHTFSVPGRYRYECVPHAPTGSGEIHVFEDERPDGATLTPTPTPGVQSGTAVVEVAPGGELAFRPGTDTPLRVTPGTTVRFVWRGPNHNIVVTDQPDGASWAGTPGPRTRTYDEGYVHEHTFYLPGRYSYVCHPHAPGANGEVHVVDV